MYKYIKKNKMRYFPLLNCEKTHLINVVVKKTNIYIDTKKGKIKFYSSKILSNQKKIINPLKNIIQNEFFEITLRITLNNLLDYSSEGLKSKNSSYLLIIITFLPIHSL